MSKVLSQLLGIDDPLFMLNLKRLEQASGHASVDVRLTAEIVAKSHQKSRELGLDPTDTTGQELYHALLELAKRHDGFLAARIGATDPTDVADVLRKLKKFVDELQLPKAIWGLKPAVAKQLLRVSPPKKVMKQLGFRSLDSMLKRFPVPEIYAGIQLLETTAWQESFIRKYKKLQPADFETRDVQFVALDAKRWGSLADDFVRSSHQNLLPLKELGAVVIAPLPVTHLPGVTIAVLPLLLHQVNELRVCSTYFKMRQVHPRFGEVVADILLKDPAAYATMAGHDVHWRTIHRHFGQQDLLAHSEMFEPHIQAEDLHWQAAEETLYKIEPALHFWHNMDYVAVRKDDQIISFNLMDIAVSYANNLPYGQHVVGHFRESLWNELSMRYLAQPAVESQVLRQLEPTQAAGSLTSLNMEEMFA